MITDIFFDLDDTLFDFRASERAAIEKTLEHFGVTPTERICLRYSELNLSQWKLLEKGIIDRKTVKLRRFELLFRELGVSVSGKEATAFYEAALSQGHLFLPGAKELLGVLFGKYRLFIVTNGTASVQHGRIASAGIAPYFENIFISEEIGADKPSKAFFDACFHKIDRFCPKNALIVGDSLTSDIRGGLVSGLHTVWFNPQGLSHPQDICPEKQIHTLDELPAVVTSLQDR